MVVYLRYVVTLLINWTHILERYMARLVLKNGRQKDMCYNEIRLSNTQNLNTILKTQLPTQLKTP